MWFLMVDKNEYFVDKVDFLDLIFDECFVCVESFGFFILLCCGCLDGMMVGYSGWRVGVCGGLI